MIHSRNFAWQDKFELSPLLLSDLDFLTCWCNDSRLKHLVRRICPKTKLDFRMTWRHLWERKHILPKITSDPMWQLVYKISIVTLTSKSTMQIQSIFSNRFIFKWYRILRSKISQYFWNRQRKIIFLANLVKVELSNIISKFVVNFCLILVPLYR